VCDGNAVLRRHLIALLLDLYLAHGRPQFGYRVSPLDRIRPAVCFNNELSSRGGYFARVDVRDNDLSPHDD
jgi:hypothetical protein